MGLCPNVGFRPRLLFPYLGAGRGRGVMGVVLLLGLHVPPLLLVELSAPLIHVPQRKPTSVVASVDGGFFCVRRDRRRLLPPSHAGFVPSLLEMAVGLASPALFNAGVPPPPQYASGARDSLSGGQFYPHRAPPFL